VTLTTAEAAALLGISTATVRMLVHRGKLTPVRRGARPLRFHAADVWDLQVARLTAAELADRARLWAEVDAMLELPTDQGPRSHQTMTPSSVSSSASGG
jgi:excisionase family DNA binding protein